MFFARSRRLLKDGIEISRRFFNSKIPKPISGYFDDRTLGLLAVLISVPTVIFFNYNSINFLIAGCLHMESSQRIKN